MNKIIVIVNKSFDGYASGFAAWMKFKNDAKYFVSGYNQPLPEIELDKNTNVYILDFSYSKEIMLDIYNKVNSLTLIENTKTVFEEIGSYPFSTICMREYSCYVASRLLFHPSLSVPARKWESIKITTTLDDQNEYKKSIINEFISDETRISYFDYYKCIGIGHNCIAVYNCINFISETANNILKKDISVDFTVSYQYYKDTVKFDLRTTPDKEVDVSKIAEFFGGEGSKNTASFIVPISKVGSMNDFIDQSNSSSNHRR